jgi:hypothetical protein
MSFPSLFLASPNLTLSWLRLFVKCVSFFCLYQPSAKNVIQYLFSSFARLSLPSADLLYSHFPFRLFVCGSLMLKQLSVFVQSFFFCFCLNLWRLSPSLPLFKC